MYARGTFSVKPQCTHDVVYRDNPAVHHAYMAVKSNKKRGAPLKKVVLRPTKIRLWREWRGKTLEETAAGISDYLHAQGIKKGYTHNSLGRLERGEFQYKQQILEAIAFVLEVDEGWLLSRDPPAPGEPIPTWVNLERAPEPVREEIEEHARIVLKRAGIR
jgi:hypothetical protein